MFFVCFDSPNYYQLDLSLALQALALKYWGIGVVIWCIVLFRWIVENKSNFFFEEINNILMLISTVDMDLIIY